SGKDEQREQTIAEDLVVTKYKMGGDIANRVEVSSSGVSVLSLCEKGDAMIMEETGKIFKKEKEMKKGIAFPTSFSVNNCDYILKKGDLVKIDLGVHVDGFIANVAHTFVVDVVQGTQVTGRKVDVIKAAHLCAEAALHLVKPGNQNTQNKVAHSFNCTPIEGMLSHQLKQHVIDGEKTLSRIPQTSRRSTMKKLNLTYMKYMLWMFSARPRMQDREPLFTNETPLNSILMPCRLRAFEDEKKAWMGVVECAKHELLQPFNVLYEKEGEFVAQFKFTVLLMPSGPMRITGGPFKPDLYKFEIEV
uniref:Peptidase M24 domain-containing protein n=1 Tax=Nomascus leucogenys TaxID=61853 RepID=A0A2I3HTI3_NOMLE